MASARVHYKNVIRRARPARKSADILRSMRVLVVEDEIFVRLMAVDAIEDAGYGVIEAENADRADMVMAASVDAARDLDLHLADVMQPRQVVEARGDAGRHVRGARVRSESPAC